MTSDMRKISRIHPTHAPAHSAALVGLCTLVDMVTLVTSWGHPPPRVHLHFARLETGLHGLGLCMLILLKKPCE